jgi:hypothetical protein
MAVSATLSFPIKAVPFHFHHGLQKRFLPLRIWQTTRAHGGSLSWRPDPARLGRYTQWQRIFCEHAWKTNERSDPMRVRHMHKKPSPFAGRGGGCVLTLQMYICSVAAQDEIKIICTLFHRKDCSLLNSALCGEQPPRDLMARQNWHDGSADINSDELDYRSDISFVLPMSGHRCQLRWSTQHLESTRRLPQAGQQTYRPREKNR